MFLVDGISRSRFTRTRPFPPSGSRSRSSGSDHLGRHPREEAKNNEELQEAVVWVQTEEGDFTRSADGRRFSLPKNGVPFYVGIDMHTDERKDEREKNKPNGHSIVGTIDPNRKLPRLIHTIRHKIKQERD